MIKKAVFLALALLPLLAALIALGATPATASPAPVHPATRTHVVQHATRLTNCEDVDRTPCWTFDDGAYRVVTSYAPYRSHTVRLCLRGQTRGTCLSRLVRAAHYPTRAYLWTNRF